MASAPPWTCPSARPSRGRRGAAVGGCTAQRPQLSAGHCGTRPPLSWGRGRGSGHGSWGRGSCLTSPSQASGRSCHPQRGRLQGLWLPEPQSNASAGPRACARLVPMLACTRAGDTHACAPVCVQLPRLREPCAHGRGGRGRRRGPAASARVAVAPCARMAWVCVSAGRRPRPRRATCLDLACHLDRPRRPQEAASALAAPLWAGDRDR